MSRRILVVDDEPNILEVLRIVLEGEGYEVCEAATYKAAAQALASEDFELVICDIKLPDGNGLDLLRAHHDRNPDTRFTVITAHSTPANLLASLRGGAVEYLSKPFDVEELRVVVAKQLQRGAGADEAAVVHGLVGGSRAMRPVVERLPQVAESEATVLITGESGTGKELLARAIHAASPRAAQPFVPINCGALPEGLLESELFGHVRGAFTGAVSDKRGLFDEANRGTLFLDEIGELTLALQVKLLRALQDKKVRPVGGNRESLVDVRVIAATNRDLQRLIEAGRFREDLYFRIDVLHLHLPPLRERREDIPVLAATFVERACTRLGLPAKELHRDVTALLEAYSWPGNVRELENVIERAVAMERSSLITVGSLPTSLLSAASLAASRDAGLTLPVEGLDIEAHLDAIRRDLMRQALKRCRGVQKEAAGLLHMTYRAFRYHAEKYRLTTEE